jgi:hypothetical protein
MNKFLRIVLVLALAGKQSHMNLFLCCKESN